MFFGFHFFILFLEELDLQKIVGLVQTDWRAPKCFCNKLVFFYVDLILYLNDCYHP